MHHGKILSRPAFLKSFPPWSGTGGGLVRAASDRARREDKKKKEDDSPPWTWKQKCRETFRGKQADLCSSKQTHASPRCDLHPGPCQNCVPILFSQPKDHIGSHSHRASGYECYRLQLETLCRCNYPISWNCGPRQECGDGRNTLGDGDGDCCAPKGGLEDQITSTTFPSN